LHPAPTFHEYDGDALRARVAERGFALIVGVDQGRPLVAHAPVLLSGDELRFHLSAANPLTSALAASPRALAVVTGADAYVSPDWYGLPDQVPTWNYVSVEIEGAVRALDRDGTCALLDELARRHEAALAPKPPWTRAKMAPDRFEAMLRAIVAFAMRVERLQGITKLSQNKSREAMAGVARALSGLEDAGAKTIAGLMFKSLPEV
jgi:transcriptional regulator